MLDRSLQGSGFRVLSFRVQGLGFGAMQKAPSTRMAPILGK